MINPGQEVSATKAALKSRGFHVSDIWLQDCVDYFRSENNSYSLKQLETFVFDQWLLADLRDFEVGCFPPNLASHNQITVGGKMACQVEAVRDIGHPAYSQMQKIRNEDLSNLDLEDPSNKFQQAWEPKSNRMLFLNLCDGVQNVHGMEYKPVPQLKIDLIPGTKVLIVGPVQCRRGVFFLERNNIEICGGEVGSLVVTNAYENILARELNLPENPDPYRIAPQPEPQVQLPPVQPPVQPTMRPPVQPAMWPPIQPGVRHQIQQGPSAVQYNRPDRQPQRPRTMVQQSLSWGSVRQPQKKASEVPTADDFPDDDDLMAIDLNLDSQDWNYVGNFEDDFNFPDECGVSIPKPSLNKPVAKPGENNKPQPRPSTNTTQSIHMPMAADSGFELGSDDDDELFLAVEAPMPSVSTSVQALPTTSNISTEKCIGKAETSFTVASKLASIFVKSNVNRETSALKRPASSVLKDDRIVRKPLFVKSSSQEVSSTSDAKLHRQETLFSVDNEDSWSGFMEPLLEAEVLGQPENKGTEQTSTNPVDITSAPFVYLSQIVDLKKAKLTTYRVKAAIISVETLKITGDEWRLAGNICDGSAKVTVRFSPSVLEEIIGMSASSVQLMRKEAKPEMKQTLKKTLEQAQNRMVNLNCLLDVQLTEHGDMPIVTGVQGLLPSTLAALRARRLSSTN